MMSPVSRLEYCFQNSWSRSRMSSVSVRQRLAVDLHDDAEGRSGTGYIQSSGKLSSTKNSFLGLWSKITLVSRPLMFITATWPETCTRFSVDMHVFTSSPRLQLVELHAPLGVRHVFLEAALRILGRGRVDLAVRVDAAQAAGRFPSGRPPPAAAGSAGCGSSSAGSA